MTLQESFATCIKKYADFSGRAPRSEYWWFILAQFLLGFVAGFVLGFIGGIMGMGTSLADIGSVVLMLGLFLPALGVAIRRLHDTGKSGWWYLLVFIPIIGWLVLLYWFVQPSTEGTNEYGEAPVL